jgi:hypothetical protein
MIRMSITKNVSFWESVISLILMVGGEVLRKANIHLMKQPCALYPQIRGLGSASVNNIVNLNHSFEAETIAAISSEHVRPR